MRILKIRYKHRQMLGTTLFYHVDRKVPSASPPKRAISVFSKALHGCISGSSIAGDFKLFYLGGYCLK